MARRELKLSDKHLRALGRINADFQELEFILIGSLGIVLGDENVGSIIASYLPFKGLTELLEAILKDKFPPPAEQIEAFSGLFRRIRAAEDERNRFIHSSWAVQPSGGHYWRRKYVRGSPIPRFEEFTSAQMEAIAASMRVLVAELRFLMEHVGGGESSTTSVGRTRSN
ncbi:MAG TPA: hypothetical protein VMW62_19065 [Chloroflexota bacterium]|nr:hypothetical protein [Chloroflexota bacterium]